MTYTPGDIFVAHDGGPYTLAIEIGERLHGYGKASRWTHAGIITTPAGGTIEAQGRGVVRADMSNHPDSKTLACPAGVDRSLVVAYATAHLNAEYGYLDALLLGIDCLTHLTLHEHGDSFICSELVAAALKAGGWKSSRPSALTYPANLDMVLRQAGS